MPGQDLSDKIGKSSSPAIDRVIENNTNVHQPYPSVQDAVDHAHNKFPITDMSRTQDKSN